jgi:hypothetical protein
MEVLLTSFGIAEQSSNDGLFYRMPPAAMTLPLKPGERLRPDYTALLLCDRLVIDAAAWDRLSSGAHHPLYEETADLMQRLHGEGLLRIEDFTAVLGTEAPLLEEMTTGDLRGGTGRWLQHLYEWADGWDEFVQSETGRNISRLLRMHLPEELGYRQLHQLPGADYDCAPPVTIWLTDGSTSMSDMPDLPLHVSQRDRSSESLRRLLRSDRQLAKNVIRRLLDYVNANLLLARHYNLGLHDWSHFNTFYRSKFLAVGQGTPPGVEGREKIKQLFEVSFPELNTWDPSRFMKILTDKRIAELRRLVDSAISANAEFDREFAARTLQEVLWLEKRTTRVRNIASWITLPLGFLPMVGTPVEKLVDEVAARIIDRKINKDYRWFFLISDVPSIK